jgi:hypothetical protein
MPALSVWMVRTALVHLAVGFLLGALLLANRGIPIHPLVPRLLPLHGELLLLGWTVQLAFGVAFWILPRYRSGAARGSELLGWLCYALLNNGVLAVGVGAITGRAGMPLLGRMAEGFAALAFAGHAWGRARPFGFAGP